MFKHPGPIPKEKTEALLKGLSSVGQRGWALRPQPFAECPDEQNPDAQWEQDWGQRVINVVRCVDSSFEEHFFQIS